MKTILHVLIAGIIFGLGTSSCEKSDPDSEKILETNLLQSEEKYHRLLQSRSAKSEAGDFMITHIQRRANILTISVTGGCAAEDFFVVWDGSIMLSSPGQVNLVLHTASGTDCGTDHTFDIAVNLSKVMGARDPADFIFNVANGSAKQNLSLNPDGSVVSF